MSWYTCLICEDSVEDFAGQDSYKEYCGVCREVTTWWEDN